MPCRARGQHCPDSYRDSLISAEAYRLTGVFFKTSLRDCEAIYRLYRAGIKVNLAYLTCLCRGCFAVPPRNAVMVIERDLVYRKVFFCRKHLFCKLLVDSDLHDAQAFACGNAYFC